MGTSSKFHLAACMLVISILLLLLRAPLLAATSNERPVTGVSNRPINGFDWSRGVVESTLQRFSDPTAFGSWAYDKALYLYGQYIVYKRTGESSYLQYIKDWIDTLVDDDGNIRATLDSLDNMLPGNLVLILYEETGESKYKLAAEKIRRRLDTYPRTSDGGFWHAVSRPWQLWLDGMFMSMPFLVRYGQMFGDSTYANDEAADQLLIYASHLKHAWNGLLYHAYNELRHTNWADPETGHSPEFWSRAVGWYGMALIEVLESLPEKHAKRSQLIAIVQDLVAGLANYQDSETGLWYQVIDRGDLSRNWQETSSSCMHVYTIYMAFKRGYVDTGYRDVALLGYQGVLTKIYLGTDGLTYLTDISESTGVGNLNYYLGRRRNVNDWHGLGPFLIMNEQLVGDGN